MSQSLFVPTSLLSHFSAVWNGPCASAALGTWHEARCASDRSDLRDGLQVRFGVLNTSEIEFRVLEQDGLSYAVDVLVLKHAQALYGLDARVVARTGVDRASLPAAGAYRQFAGLQGIAAQTVVFVGTRPKSEFSYSDCRQFGSMALASVKSTNASEVALTLHGIGYGLDEVECFDAEVAGLLDAIESDDVPSSVRTITFLEIDAGRAARVRKRLVTLLGPESTVNLGAEAAWSVTRGTLRTVGESRAHAFVAMPFDESFSDVFHYGLANAVRANGLLCERIDKQAFVGDILQRLKDQIRGAKVVIADVTDANANVFLEVGFAWGHEVPTVFVCQEGNPLEFDIQGQRCIYYGSIRDLEEKLGTELAEILPRL